MIPNKFIKCISNEKDIPMIGHGDQYGELHIGEIYELETIQVCTDRTFIKVKGISHIFNSVLFDHDIMDIWINYIWNIMNDRYEDIVYISQLE